MSVIKEKRAELSDYRALGDITGVMRDLASVRVNTLRAQFEQNVSFYHELQDLYDEVKRVMAIRYRQTLAQRTPRPKAGIAITSNQRFYGGLNRRVIDMFRDDWRTNDEHIVIGATGAEYMASLGQESQYRTVRFASDQPAEHEIRELANQLMRYDRIRVYYPQFDTLFHQEPGVLDVEHMPGPASDEELGSEDYIFEPNLIMIHDFFGSQIQQVLLRRVMMETDLARTATRMTRMHEATHTARERMDRTRRDLRRAVNTKLDAQLHEAITALQWMKETDNS